LVGGFVIADLSLLKASNRPTEKQKTQESSKKDESQESMVFVAKECQTILRLASHAIHDQDASHFCSAEHFEDIQSEALTNT